MEDQEIHSITEIEKKEIVNVTVENIRETIREVVNKNSVIVTSSNNINFENITLKNVSATINLDMKNASCLIIDEKFTSDMNLNIKDTYVSTFYNEIVEIMGEEYLTALENNLQDAINISSDSSVFSGFDINSYTEIKNTQYINILKEIHSVVSSSNITSVINSCITNVQQYNYIEAKDLEFGFSSDIEEEEFENRKTNVEIFFDQTNTSEILVKCIANTEEINNVLTKVINKLSDYEDLPKINTELINNGEGDIIKVDESQFQQSEENTNSNTESTDKKTLNTNIILLISIIVAFLLFVILIILILIKKFKK